MIKTWDVISDKDVLNAAFVSKTDTAQQNITGAISIGGALSVSGTITGNLTGSVTGNASTATKLQTARNINGVSFDGSANISINLNNLITPGNGLTGSAFNGSAAQTWSIASHAGTAGSIGTINIGTTTIGVNLGTTSTTAFRGDYGNSAYTHISSDGSSHTFIDQDVKTTASPTFVKVTTGSINSAAVVSVLNGTSAQGINISQLLVSNAYADVTSVPTNGIYSKGNISTAGTVTWSGGGSANANTAYTHVSSTGTDHSYIDQSVTTTASPTFGGATLNGNLSFNSSDGRGMRFWNSDNYKIYMSAQGTASWGGRLDATSDYNMYFKMAGGTARGFVFKNDATTVTHIDGTGNIYTIGVNLILNAANSNADPYLYFKSRNSGNTANWDPHIRADRASTRLMTSDDLYVTGTASADYISLSGTGTTATAGAFYSGTTAPSSTTTRLNYNGTFYATQLYDGSTRVATTGYFVRTDSTSTGRAVAYNGTTQSDGRFHGGTTAPGAAVTYTLNYSGPFRATELYEGTTRVALSTISISAGTGLTGGGNLTANRTLAIDFPASGGTNGTSNQPARSDHVHTTFQIGNYELAYNATEDSLDFIYKG